MKIAVSASGGSMSAQIDERFGRCAYFVIVDSETMKFTAFANSASEYSGGSGPAAVREIAKHGAAVILTGRTGANAKQALESAHIKIVEGSSGTVKEAVEKYLKSQQ
ncbi:NifB/NifX family molybdenum-iron cluster-binding protein [candidate division KSB1 bacterium]|nr:NifB/NifX family molybdenum-iron cluster-binding protein [candidate division KSB1 bacterium]